MQQILARLIARYGPALAVVILERILRGQALPTDDETYEPSEPFPSASPAAPSSIGAGLDAEWSDDPLAEQIRWERATAVPRRSRCCMPRGCYTME